MHDEPATPGAQGEPPGRLGREAGAPSGRWRQHAGFSVFFDSAADDVGRPLGRIRLYHEETGDETTVPGHTSLDWIRWILDRVGPVPGRSEMSGSGTGTVSVEIRSARLVVGPVIGDGVENLRIEADLRVSGLAELHRGRPATVIEVVFGAQPP